MTRVPSPAPPTPARSIARDLVELVADWELWHAPDRTAYVTITVGDHREHHPLRSRVVRAALARAAYLARGRPARGEQRGEALDVLEGRAVYEGDEHPVHVRVAGHQDAVYIDLGDAAWRVVEVTTAGWRVVTDPPVRFWRGRALRALPVPVPGGSLAPLREVVPVARDEDWTLLVAWLLAALRPRGPYPASTSGPPRRAIQYARSRFARA